jgi:hypothetical protein
MMRALALALLFALGVGLAAPALTPAPAFAATNTEIAGLPSLPWQKIGQWVLKNAVTLLMLVEEIWRDVQGGSDKPGDPPNQPPPTPLVVEAG